MGDLRSRSAGLWETHGPTLRLEQADVQHLHVAPRSAGACFQVASQFNLLEMVGPNVTPEDGVGRYEDDPTQGPACAIAAGAGTIYRNYFVQVGDGLGQTAERQVDTLADLGALLGNSEGRLWNMRNGYALADGTGLAAIAEHLGRLDANGLDRLRSALRVGVQWDTEVTQASAGHTVTQVYCSALPVSYCYHPLEAWEPFARLVLEAAYEATLLVAAENSARTGNRTVYLTQLGGGAFGNRDRWIVNAAEKAIHRCAGLDLDLVFVTFRPPGELLQNLVDRSR